MLDLAKNKNKITNAQLVSEYDFYSYTQSVHYHGHNFLGAQHKEIKGQEGILFALWAPKAKAVSLVGDFNNWRVNANPMNKIYNDGLWALWLPKLQNNFAYQFAIHEENGLRYINDPYAKQIKFSDSGNIYVPKALKDKVSMPERLASIFNKQEYNWSDSEWIKRREESDLATKGISILNVDIKSYFQSYQSIAKDLVSKVKASGFTHVLLDSVLDEISDLTDSISFIRKEYQYFAPSHSYGNPEDFKCFVDYLHANGIGVILNLPFLEQNIDLKQTNINQLLSSAVFWLEEFHIDAFKFKVRESIPFEFVKTLNEVIHARSRGVFTIIDSNMPLPNITKPTFLGGLGFNMHISKFNLEETELSLNSLNAFAENQIISIESLPQNINTAKILLALLFSFPGKKLIGMDLLSKIISGQYLNSDRLRESFYACPCQYLLRELGQANCDLEQYIKDLNELYIEHQALSETDFRDTCFEWVNYSGSQLSFLRWSRDYSENILVLINLSKKNIYAHKVGVAQPGLYLELFNSDNLKYGGSDISNAEGLYTVHQESDSREHSLITDLAARSVLIYRGRT